MDKLKDKRKMLSKEKLYDLYITQNLPIKEIIKQYNIPNATLYRLLKKYNINSSRSASISKEKLYDLYITQNLPQWKIGEMFNCDRKAIARLCKKYNIEKEYISKDDIINTFNNSNSYIEMAKKLNTTPNTCSKYCQKYGIKYDFSIKDKYYKDDIINKIKDLSENQLSSIRDIEKEINVPRNVISKIIKNNNIKTAIDYGYNPHNLNISIEHNTILNNKKLLIKFIKNNNIVSVNHLGKLFNISSSFSYTMCKKHNIMHLFPKQSSYEEMEVLNYVKQFYHTENNVRILDGKEIDIFIPQLNIGIEFNGNYWHSEKHTNKNYHQEKSKIAELKNIFLYHIFEYEWNTKKEQIINQLNNLLCINQEKIYARKCIIKEIMNREKTQFLELNHLQGNDKSKIKLGLYHNNNLVSVMTFNKPRFNSNYEWELSRFCSKAGCNVIGGASKLFKYFINTYNPQSVISYSNIAHTRGKLYETLGFKLDSISDPNYIWINGCQDIKSRYQCQKHKLLEQGYQGNSESDIMHKLKYYRIYDCGNKVWIWNKKSKN